MEVIRVEMNTYTDGDWGFDYDLLSNYVSKYFENDLYEYTNTDGCYSCSFRRVFDTSSEAIGFVKKFAESVYGDEYYKKLINEQISDVIDEFKKYGLGSHQDDGMGNSEFSIEIAHKKTRGKIKEIIYEEKNL